MIILNSVFPVFALIFMGFILKRFNFSNEIFLRTSDKLIYYIFFPAMLFWKIGGAAPMQILNGALCAAALCTVLTVYLASCMFIRFGGVSNFEAGSFSQSCYRFNTYLGMAIIMTALGENGVRIFGVLIGIVIPCINVLAVSTLIWFCGRNIVLSQRLRITLKALGSNPLIIACGAGLVYSGIAGSFPISIDNTFRLISSVTLPLALISIGGSLSLKHLKGYGRLSAAASIFKLLIFPVIGFFYLKYFDVAEPAFRVGMIFFALPTSTANYILSSQLNSNTDLAVSSIIFSTLFSFFSLSIVLLL